VLFTVSQLVVHQNALPPLYREHELLGRNP
jgi:hypothetical protein